MGRIIVVQFTTIGGAVEDRGSDGTVLVLNLPATTSPVDDRCRRLRPVENPPALTDAPRLATGPGGHAPTITPRRYGGASVSGETARRCHGPQGVAGDKFRLGPVLGTDTLLFGRRTWEHFSTLWPTRDDPFSSAMNKATKAVASSGRPDLSAWSNSHHVDGPLAAWTRTTKEAVDIEVIGSGSVITRLADEGLVDEYRLLIFPAATGAGRRLLSAQV